MQRQREMWRENIKFIQLNTLIFYYATTGPKKTRSMQLQLSGGGAICLWKCLKNRKGKICEKMQNVLLTNYPFCKKNENHAKNANFHTFGSCKKSAHCTTCMFLASALSQIFQTSPAGGHIPLREKFVTWKISEYKACVTPNDTPGLCRNGGSTPPQPPTQLCKT